MKNTAYRNYYILSVIGTLLASFYPLYMGVKVVWDMIMNGVVQGEDYPKYIIPYTPISLAIILGVVLMPVLMKIGKKFALLIASGVSLAVFLVTELLLENMVIVEQSLLSDWQMWSCMVYPDTRERFTAVEILVGDYDPMFKMHFYVIAIVIIISLLNCFYGFGNVIKNNDKRRLKPLILQAISSVLFLGLCILACFTAFFRTGDIYVSPVSAVLMGIFFIVFGVTMGIYTGSFFFGKHEVLSVVIPSVVAVATTILMYICEMILLGGTVYRFGISGFFRGIDNIVLAPVDVMIIILSGCITAIILLCLSINKKADLKS